MCTTYTTHTKLRAHIIQIRNSLTVCPKHLSFVRNQFRTERLETMEWLLTPASELSQAKRNCTLASKKFTGLLSKLEEQNIISGMFRPQSILSCLRPSASHGKLLRTRTELRGKRCSCKFATTLSST